MSIKIASDDAVVKAIEKAAQAACLVLDQQFPGQETGGITSNFQGLLVEVLTHMLRGRSVLDEQRGHTIELPVRIVSDRAEQLALARRFWAMFDTPITDDNTLDEPFLHFPAGTPRDRVWRWYEDYFGVSVHDDLMFPKPS